MRLKIKIYIGLGVLLFLIWIAGFVSFFHTITHIPNSKEKTDGIVILTGGKGRIESGVKLLENNPKTPLLISGVRSPLYVEDLDCAPELKKNITLGHNATTTFENAEETKKWAEDHFCASLKVVTSHYHIPRSLLELKRALPHVKLIPYPVVSSLFNDRWWLEIRAWELLIIEYNKYLVVLLKSHLK